MAPAYFRNGLFTSYVMKERLMFYVCFYEFEKISIKSTRGEQNMFTPSR